MWGIYNKLFVIGGVLVVTGEEIVGSSAVK